MPFSNKKNQDSLKKWLILELKQGKHKIILEYLVPVFYVLLCNGQSGMATEKTQKFGETK